MIIRDFISLLKHFRHYEYFPKFSLNFKHLILIFSFSGEGLRDSTGIDETEQSTSRTFPSKRKVSVVLLVAQHCRRRGLFVMNLAFSSNSIFLRISSSIFCEIHFFKLSIHLRSLERKYYCLCSLLRYVHSFFPHL